MTELISDGNEFVKINGDEAIKREGSLQRFLLSLKKGGFFKEKQYEEVYPAGSMPARLYGNPKMHKCKTPDEIPSFRPIVSSIGAYNYNLAKFLSKMITPYICHDYSCKDTFSFVNGIQSAEIDTDKFLISYDVQSLFTNIPLEETLDIAVELLLRNEPQLKISKKDLKKLFKFATSGTQFLFNGEYFDQVDGVAMGSPLAPILANLFLGHYEGKWIEEYREAKPLYYTRYVDDIFAVFHNDNDAFLFFNYLNTKHPNIKYTYETEKEHKLSFLDVSIDKSDANIITRIYRKVTFSGVLTNYLSFTPMKYKLGLIRCLIDRVFRINNTSSGFDQDLKHLFWILKRNCYPDHLLQKVKKIYLDAKSIQLEPNVETTERKVIYFKLPYLGQQSIALKSKIKKLCKKFCENTDVQLAFQAFKLSNFFSKKDKLPLRSHVVYKFNCSGCNSCYVGYTTRHFQTRVNEHFFTDKNSHVFKHLRENANCLRNAEVSDFSIVDRASTEYELKIKESMHIKWLEPSINKQRKTFKMTLSV